MADTIFENKTDPLSGDKPFINPQAASVDVNSETFWSNVKDTFRAIVESRGHKIPGWIRIVLALTVVIVGTIAVTPAITATVAAMVAGASTMTTAMWALAAVHWLGTIILVAAAAYALYAIALFILTGKVDKALANLRNRLAWMLTPDPKPLTRA